MTGYLPSFVSSPHRRMRSESGRKYPPVRCCVRRRPILATDGDDLLKYFLVSRTPPNRRE
jgi:hypothetical protein